MHWTLVAAVLVWRFGGQAPTPHLLASFTTELAQAEWARNENVRIAAGHVSGTYLRPGDQFSFNGLVGERTLEAGYAEAPVYTPVGKMDALAGGLCQLSSTIYNAALLSGMTIRERHAHSLTVRYLIPGRDATVARYRDLRFVNGHTYPIRVVLEIRGRALRCDIYGASPLGSEIDVRVSTRKLPDGRILARAEREVWRDGALVRTEPLSEDIYRPMR